jgi:cytochrome P450 family 6
MTMALYELAYRQDIQERLRDEIEEVLKRHDGKFSYEALFEMNYLDQVVNGKVTMTFPAIVNSENIG